MTAVFHHRSLVSVIRIAGPFAAPAIGPALWDGSVPANPTSYVPGLMLALWWKRFCGS